MGAPKGNQYWKLRSKHGRDKLFITPKLLWEAACEYFEWCNDNPWNKYEQGKKPPKPFKNENGEIVLVPELVGIPTARPYSLSGLCLYLDCSQAWWKKFKEAKDIEDFLSIITRIEEIIETQQFEGAIVGAYNANIIARKLGLVDKKSFGDEDGMPIRLKISKEEIREIRDALEKEI